MFRFLIIQTAFIGDVVLATALIEKLHHRYQDAKIDFLLRKGNEGLLKNHPIISKLHIWNKQKNKHLNLLRIIAGVRKEHYTHIINVHRFATSGIITLLSGAKVSIGFDKNPFSHFFSKKIPHKISLSNAANPMHEVQRNHLLIASLTDETPAMPKLYPAAADYKKVQPFQNKPYVCIAPSSVWATKQYPAEKWAQLIQSLPAEMMVYILGGEADKPLAASILLTAENENTQNLCGQLSFLQSAALMEKAVMNYANDSAPLHFASAMNAPVTAVFCSTVPAFGFGPLSSKNKVVEIEEPLYCRPCGLHGKATCPEKHFRCANDIKTQQLLWWL